MNTIIVQVIGLSGFEAGKFGPEGLGVVAKFIQDEFSKLVTQCGGSDHTVHAYCVRSEFVHGAPVVVLVNADRQNIAPIRSANQPLKNKLEQWLKEQRINREILVRLSFND